MKCNDNYYILTNYVNLKKAKMKKILGLLMMVLMLSCNDDCKRDAYVFQKIEPTREQQVIIFSEDTCLDGDQNFSDSVRIADGVVVTVNGDVFIQGSSLLMIGNSKLNVTGNIDFVNTIFFVSAGGGIIDVDGSIFVSNDSNANSGATGTIYYCTNMFNQITSGNVTIIQDCALIENPECTTLSIPSVKGYRYLGIREVNCDQIKSEENQEGDDYKFLIID